MAVHPECALQVMSETQQTLMLIKYLIVLKVFSGAFEFD